MSDDLKKKVREHLQEEDVRDLPANEQRIDERQTYFEDAETASMPPDELAEALRDTEGLDGATGLASGPGIDRSLSGGVTGGDVYGAGKGPAIGETHAPSRDANHYGGDIETRQQLSHRSGDRNFREEKNAHAKADPPGEKPSR